MRVGSRPSIQVDIRIPAFAGLTDAGRKPTFTEHSNHTSLEL
jgi:hypothetical protein